LSSFAIKLVSPDCTEMILIVSLQDLTPYGDRCPRHGHCKKLLACWQAPKLHVQCHRFISPAVQKVEWLGVGQLRSFLQCQQAAHASWSFPHLNLCFDKLWGPHIQLQYQQVRFLWTRSRINYEPSRTGDTENRRLWNKFTQQAISFAHHHTISTQHALSRHQRLPLFECLSKMIT
jgi:hypothetical protein